MVVIGVLGLSIIVIEKFSLRMCQTMGIGL